MADSDGLSGLPLDRFVGLQGAADVPPPGDQPYGQGDPNRANPAIDWWQRGGIAGMLGMKPVDQQFGENVDAASHYPMLSPEHTRVLTDNPATGISGVDAGFAGIYAGRNSLTGDLKLLQLAKLMEDSHARGDLSVQQGRTGADEIRDTTGWFRGPDKEWRYEISDDKAKLSEVPLSMFSHVPLGTVLDHPELYKAYPQLEHIPVRSTGFEFGLKGAYDPEKNAMYLNKIKPINEKHAADMLDTVLHETQHAVQTREGFSAGGNSREYYTPEQTDWLAKTKEQLKTIKNDPELKSQIDQYNEKYPGGEKWPTKLDDYKIDWMVDPGETLRNATRRDFPEFDDRMKEFPAIKAYVDAAPDRLRVKQLEHEGYNYYQSLAGEVEARDTGARQMMTPEERRLNPPYVSQKIPWENMKLKMNKAPGEGLASLQASEPMAIGGLRTANQSIASAGTSVNQRAGVFSSDAFLRNKGTRNLDYGGGKYDKGSDYLREQHGVENMVYDPYNRSVEHNSRVLADAERSPPDTVTAANVLNVIKEPKARDAVIGNAARLVKPDGAVLFDIYEGNRSGRGETTTKGWQNNRKAQDYIDEISRHFGDVQREGRTVIVARNRKR